MSTPINKKLIGLCFAAIALALIVWTVMFYNNPILKNVLLDIHLIYIGTLIAYSLIRYTLPNLWIGFLKILIRTLFRVWLIIFITLAINKPMERIGFILSITFIFGYFEGLVDLDSWLGSNSHSSPLRFLRCSENKHHLIAATLLSMSVVHLCCALVIRLFYVLY